MIDLTEADIERILFIHHIIVIGLIIGIVILWAKCRINKERIEELKKEIKRLKSN